MTSDRTNLSALILAGARGGDDPLMAGHAGLTSKALLPVAGRSMIEYPLAALRGRAAPIWVSGLTSEEAPGGLVEGPRGEGPAAALAACVEAGAPMPLLVTTADHALLSPVIVDAFVTAARATGADLCVGFARRAVIEARFPHVARTYLRFADESVSGCNLFYLSGDAALSAIRFWRQAEADRKTPWRLARHVGIGVLLRYLTGRLTLRGFFETASARTGSRIAPVLLDHAEAAVDVDKPSDLALVEDVMAGRA